MHVVGQNLVSSFDQLRLCMKDNVLTAITKTYYTWICVTVPSAISSSATSVVAVMVTSKL